ncbi:type VI secretion system baseplate subunit TssF [Pseudoduganella namucuonensis]|uniref:Type VI secretion system protein ImpG n=1 Tax=Pseudoduganella namucuonensis TaxID=1035707 RepID=A0A1I7LVC2_9BURK|nr:type VI secretion system baseplate subunit TssF [Pseudoduganella namucuonensis]SFV13645.1 type VI secretion system protein ImpG [Pseudoduganella namucuonensis]
MEKLLPYYERELGMLRRASQEFAARYPRLAGNLQMTGETCADPHVERLIQANAFLNARVAKLLDDDYAKFTEALLGMLYPHYLRPIPSMAIAHVASGAKAADVRVIERGAEMITVEEKAVCRFRTAYDVAIAPVTLADVRFHPFVQAPPALMLPMNVVSAISITIAGTQPEEPLARHGAQPLRVFIDGEPSLRAMLRDTLFLRASCAFVEAGGQWRMLDRIPLRPAGYADTDALLPAGATEHPAYRLLTEYFAFPEKFDFFDIDLDAILQACPPACARVTLHLALRDTRPDGAAARVLRALGPGNLLLNCTPVINLFQHSADPIRVTHMRSSYPLLPSGRAAGDCEIYSIDQVSMAHERGPGTAATTVTEFIPYYSLRHGESASRKGHYWIARRDEEPAGAGHEYTLSLVDRDFDPLADAAGVASVELTCTDRDRPHALQCGRPAGDLQAAAAAGVPIRLLRKPTQTRRLAAGQGAHWGLIGGLALNHRSLTQEGLPALRALLRLHALPDNPVSQRQIDGIKGLAQQPGTAWLRTRQGAAYLHGIEIRVTLDEEAYAGTGIHVFAQLLDHFFGLHAHINSYTQLTVLSHASGKELLPCPPRNGSLALA